MIEMERTVSEREAHDRLMRCYDILIAAAARRDRRLAGERKRKHAAIKSLCARRRANGNDFT